MRGVNPGLKPGFGVLRCGPCSGSSKKSYAVPFREGSGSSIAKLLNKVKKPLMYSNKISNKIQCGLFSSAGLYSTKPYFTHSVEATFSDHEDVVLGKNIVLPRQLSGEKSGGMLLLTKRKKLDFHISKKYRIKTIFLLRLKFTPPIYHRQTVRIFFFTKHNVFAV
jgi:hypothetical protein